MRSDGATFASLNNSASKKPRYVIELAFDNDKTDLLYLTSYQDDDVPPASIVAGEVIYGVVKGISGQTQSINPAAGSSTIGSFSFDVIDYAQALTVYMRDKLENGDGLRHKQIKLYIGIDSMQWADYQEALTYIVDGVSYHDGVYSFACSDRQREARNEIFSPHETNLSETVTSAQLYIPVIASDLGQFPTVDHDGAYSTRPNEHVGYAQIEDEIFIHSGLYNHPTAGVSFSILQRGALNTKPAEHVLDDNATEGRSLKIKELIYLEGPAPKIIYALLTGVLYEQFDASSPPVQEVLPEHWCLGMDVASVKLSDYTGIGVDLWDTGNDTGRQVLIKGPKPGDGKRFIEKELLLWLGCYMPVYASGELGLKRLSPVLSDSGHLMVLDQYNVANYTQLKHGYNEVINNIRVLWNHDYAKDDFTKTSVLIDAESIAKHNQAPVKELALFAVHTGKHTDEDIRNYFDTMRDRYSGPPLRLSVETVPSLNRLEVGDTIRLSLPQIRDFSEPGGVEIDRAFEIQRVQINWLTGLFKLDLFGSSQPAGTLIKTSETSVLDDAFYSSQGVELSTVLTISGGVVTASGSLTGAALMDDAIFYYLGDLAIAPGVTVTIGQNVQLRIRGAFTINGAIDGAENGLAGAAGATLFTINGTKFYDSVFDLGTDLAKKLKDNAVPGAAGYLGTTVSTAQAYLYIANGNRLYDRYVDGLTVKGAVDSVAAASLVNNGVSIQGLPTDLRGSSGSGARGVLEFAGGPSNFVYELKHDGGDGGAGGAGLLIISRGLSFGAAGSIDTSGGDGKPGEFGIIGNRVIYGGSGAGGAPGALMVLLDGNHTPPELTDQHVALHGDSAIPDGATWYPRPFDLLLSGDASYPWGNGLPGWDMGSSAYKVQQIPANESIDELTDPPPPDVITFTVGSSGSTAVIRWTGVSDNNLDGYEIRISPQTVNSWPAATILTAAAKGTRITDTAIADGDWRFYIKAYDLAGQYSQNAATYDASIISQFDVIEQNDEQPAWGGTLTNFVKHHTGALLPQSQDADSTDDAVMDVAILNPFDSCSYESTVLDIAFDDTARAYTDVQGQLFPTEAGDVDITTYIDYRLEAGAFDGFEQWLTGDVIARYIKFKFTLDVTKGVSFIASQRIVADQAEIIQEGLSVSVGASGLSIVFDRVYHTPPAVQVFMVGGGAVFATASLVTATGFTINIYNTSGTGVSGTVNWKATGV